MLCKCSLFIDDPFWQWLLLLIDFYIDSWDYWDCVLSVIATARPYMHPLSLLLMCLSLLSVPLISVSVLWPVYTSPYLLFLPSINPFVCWWKSIFISGIVWIVIAGIVGSVFCLFLQPYVLLMRPFCLSLQSVPLSDDLLMCPFLCSVIPLIYWSIYQLIYRSQGEYWCLGFEIDTTCPVTIYLCPSIVVRFSVDRSVR